MIVMELMLTAKNQEIEIKELYMAIDLNRVFYEYPVDSHNDSSDKLKSA